MSILDKDTCENSMNDKDLDDLYNLNSRLYDSWNLIAEHETDPEAREAMYKHIDALDLILGFLEKSKEKRNEIRKELR